MIWNSAAEFFAMGGEGSVVVQAVHRFLHPPEAQA